MFAMRPDERRLLLPGGGVFAAERAFLEPAELSLVWDIVDEVSGLGRRG